MNNAIVVTLMTVVITVPSFFDTSLYSCFDLSKISVLWGLVFIASGLWCVKVISGNIGKFRLPALGFPVMAMLMTTGLATIFSVSPYMSLVGTHKRYGGLISEIVYALLFFLIVRFVMRKHVDAFVSIIILSVMVSVIYGLCQTFGLDLTTWKPLYFGRISSTFGNPIFYSVSLAMAIPLVLMRIFEGRRLYLFLPILCLLLLAFYQASTRASFVGLAVAMIFFFSMVGKRVLLLNKKKVAIAMVLVIGITCYCNINKKSSIMTRFASVVVASDTGYHLHGSALMRLIMCKVAVKIVCDYPVFGIGPDVLGMIYPRYFKSEHGMGFENNNRIHSEPFHIAVSTGLIGLAAYLWLILAFVFMVFKRFRNSNYNDRLLLIGLVSGIISYFVQNLLSFGHVPIIMLFWVLVGLSVVVIGGE